MKLFYSGGYSLAANDTKAVAFLYWQWKELFMKIIIFLAEGFEEAEACIPVDIFRRAGIPAEMVSISDKYNVTGSHGMCITADRLFSEADFNSADLIFLPGGQPGTRNLEAFSPLLDEIKDFEHKGKRIAAICAAPGILGRLGLLKGRKACSYPSVENQLMGAEVTAAEYVTDGNITTSRGMGTAIPFALEIVRLLMGKECADKIGKSIIYNLR